MRRDRPTLLGRRALPKGPAQVWRLQAIPLMEAACGSRLGDLASRTPPTSMVFPPFFISAAQGCAHTNAVRIGSHRDAQHSVNPRLSLFA